MREVPAETVPGASCSEDFMLRHSLVLASFIGISGMAVVAVGCSKERDGQAHAEAAATARVAGDQAARQPDGTVFGDGVKLSDSTAISKILANPNDYAGTTVRVEGMITDVCPKRGCWFEMAGEGTGEKLRFKVTDGVMVFPVDAKGKYAVAEGVISARELTMEESHEYLAYQAREYGKEYDPDQVTEPVMVVRMDGTGAVIRDGK